MSGNEHDAEAGRDAIEVMVREWELLGVGGEKFHIFEPTAGGVFFGALEHFADEIGGDDAALRANGSSDGESGFAGAAGEIENVEAGGERGAFDDEFGGAAGLLDELRAPFFPEGGGSEPFLADGFAGVGVGGGGGHDF